ncbi:glycosyltransferase [Thermicanus aegyptius]|uniref:glycosyltransferase n=1 Tax=Thermicanus aegyptius TaxID=94009 RepID=UPI00048E5D7B|nr:glycosyltransferase [Thermicanus aegyptius]
MSDSVRLSLCMIVKNEADCIARCLESAGPLVDEIIVVDTGSTDGTDAICRSLGAKVFSFRWNDDFSEARNYSLSLAQGEWILWLDADEEIEASPDELRELTASEAYDLYSFRLNNYYGARADRNQVITIAHPRLFRNRIGFRFHQRIHETLNVEEVLPGPDQKERIGSAPITIWHYGYLDDYVKKKGKAERNLSLLKEEVAKNENDPWLHYHLAAEYYRAQKFNLSFQHVNRSIILFILANQTPPSLLYKLKYSILLSMRSFEGAYPAIEKAIALYPDYVDLIFYKAVILLHLDKPLEAIGALDRCLEIGEQNLKHLTQKGLGSFQAWYCKGLCYEKLNDLETAERCYRNALALTPNHSEAEAALVRLKRDSN